MAAPRTAARHRAALAALLVLAATALPLAARAQEPAPLALGVSAPQEGVLELAVTGRDGATVTIVEEAAGGAEPVATVTLAGGTAAVRVPWRCDRLERRFVATAPAEGGGEESASAAATTGGCQDRVELRVPERAQTGSLVELEAIDRWGHGGFAATVCRRAPGGLARCHEVALPAGEARVAPAFAAERPGRWRVELTTPFGGRAQAAVGVRNGDGALRVLATGDSMIQIVDAQLAQRLREEPGASVESDAHPATGISKPFLLDWRRLAREHAERLRPDVTVVFLGANDGFDMRTPRGRRAPCCGRAWIAEYARRARQMMAPYSRGGAGRVYWLLLPAPRGGDFARVFRGVNAAVELAARSYRETVEVLDLRRTFTPGGRFRRTIRRGGRTIVVRQGDGVHLSVAGASIAARIVHRALRRDGVVF
jgi:lysophospholipase L1-like esterase